MSELVYYINYMQTYQMRINVSVVIPVYNVEPYIKRCVESLMSKTLKTGIEFIFVNDCSTDNSVNLIEEVVSCYSERKDQVRIIHHSSNKGLACTRLTGIKEAKGDYIIQCDSDDWVDQNSYQTMKDILTRQENKSADIVKIGYKKIFKDRIVEFVPCVKANMYDLEEIRKTLLPVALGSRRISDSTINTFVLSSCAHLYNTR